MFLHKIQGNDKSREEVEGVLNRIRVFLRTGKVQVLFPIPNPSVVEGLAALGCSQRRPERGPTFSFSLFAG